MLLFLFSYGKYFPELKQNSFFLRVYHHKTSLFDLSHKHTYFSVGSRGGFNVNCVNIFLILWSHFFPTLEPSLVFFISLSHLVVFPWHLFKKGILLFLYSPSLSPLFSFFSCWCYFVFLFFCCCLLCLFSVFFSFSFFLSLFLPLQNKLSGIFFCDKNHKLWEESFENFNSTFSHRFVSILYIFLCILFYLSLKPK